MSDVDEKNDEFGTRRRKAIFGDDGDDDTGDDEDNGDGDGEGYTEIELKAEREDLLGRKVYTEDSIEDFISALKDGADYNEATEAYLKLTPDESEDEPEGGESGEQDLLSREYPLMKKQMEEQEKSSDDEYPKLTEELKKKKKTVSPEEWDLDKEYPSMKDLPKKNQSGDKK